MSALKNRIQDEMKAAMRAKEKVRLGTIRLALAAIKQKEVDERIELTDEHIISIIEKMLKQRRDSISQYEAADRQELADQEKAEIAILQDYMPAQMDETEVAEIVANAIASSGAAGPQDMGKVMGTIKPQIQGRADMGTVSRLVKEKLSAL